MPYHEEGMFFTSMIARICHMEAKVKMPDVRNLRWNFAYIKLECIINRAIFIFIFVLFSTLRINKKLLNYFIT